MTQEQIAMSFSLSGSILSLGLIALAGYIAQTSGLFGENGRKIMGDIMLKITFPCLGFYSMVTKVDPQAFSQNMLAIGMGMLILIFGLIIGYIAVIPLKYSLKTRNTFVHLLSTCNYIFLPLPIVISLWPKQEGTMFLHTLGCGLVYWIVGIYPLTKGQPLSTRIKNVFNRPMLSMILGLIVAFMGGGDYLKQIPDTNTLTFDNSLYVFIKSIMQSLDIMGSATIPLALICVGATLASSTAKTNKKLLCYYSLMRLVVIPILFVPFVKLSGMSLEASYIPLLISMMPASNVSTVITHKFGGDEDLASAANLWSTPLALLTVPIIFPFLSSL